MTTPPPNQQVSRRSIAKGLAWAVPAVSAASTLPAFASSPDPNCSKVGIKVNWAQMRDDLRALGQGSTRTNLVLDGTPVYYDLTTGVTTLSQPTSGPWMSATLQPTTYYVPENETGFINSTTGLTIQFSSSISEARARCKATPSAVDDESAYMRYTFTFSEPMDSVTVPVYNVSFSEDMIIRTMTGSATYTSHNSGTTTAQLDSKAVEIYGNGRTDARNADVTLTDTTGFTLAYGWKDCKARGAHASFITPLVVTNTCS